MRYNPALDGLRACAAIMVLAMHAKMPWACGGNYGVDIFFVLSGYLITKLLVAELSRANQIRIGTFYLRRALRLYPALIVFLISYVVIAPIVYSVTYLGAIYEAALSALYVTDYSRAFFNTPSGIPHTWSLSVEEHFYLLWPIALLLLMRRFGHATTLKIVMYLAVTATLWRLFCFLDGQSRDNIYFRFDTRMSGLLVGCIYALMRIQSMRWQINSLIGLAGIAIIAAAMRYAPNGHYQSILYGVTAAEIGAVLLVHALVNGEPALNPFRKILSVRPLRFLGRISYGVYLWHFPIVLFLIRHHSAPFSFAVGLLVSATIASLSYYGPERLARHWSHRIKHSRYTKIKGEVTA